MKALKNSVVARMGEMGKEEGGTNVDGAPDSAKASHATVNDRGLNLEFSDPGKDTGKDEQ